MEAIWNGSIFIPRYASPKNPHGEIPPSPPAEQRHRRENAVRRALRSFTGRLPENWRAMAGLVNGGVVNDGHAMVNAGVIRAHAPILPGFWNDQFTGTAGTDLGSHTANIGGGYTLFGSAGIQLTGSGEIVTTANSPLYLNAATPPSADYTVTCVLKYPTKVNAFGIVGRGVDATHMVNMEWNGPMSEIHLNQENAGHTTLAATAHTPAGDETWELIFSGTGVTCKINGTHIVSGTTALVAAGKVGILTFFSGAGGPNMSNAYAHV